tara:strand:+ start:1916 stop:3694 length:1779 start_codon:yes stop_codon:yes gene_type:complete
MVDQISKVFGDKMIARQNELTEESVAQLNSVSKGIFGIIGAVKEDTQKNKEFMKGQTERLKGFFGKGIRKFIPKSSKEDKNEARRDAESRNDAIVESLKGFGLKLKEGFKTGKDKLSGIFAPLGAILKALVVGGFLFLLVKKLPQILNSPLYKEIIKTIDTIVIPALFRFYENFLVPFGNFFKEGFMNVFQDINDESKSTLDVLKENGMFLLKAFGTVAALLYPKAIFSLVFSAGKLLVGAVKLLPIAFSTIKLTLLKVNTTLLASAKTVGASALKGLMAAGVAVKGALVTLGVGIKAAIMPLLVPLAPFLLIGAAVVGALALAINTLTEIRKKFDQAPGILSKIKLIISAIITAPFTFLQKIGVFIAEKLGFTKFAEAFGSIDFIQVFMNFFSDLGAKIKGLFPASVFQFLDGLNIEEAIINKVTELRESLFGAIGNIFGNVGLGLTTLKNDILGFLADILEKFTFLGIGPKIAKFIRGATEEPEETTTPVEQRQTGGPVKQGGLYLVGEKGPELFKPNMGGMVANQAKTQNIMQTALDSAMSMMGGSAGQVTTTNVVNNMPKTETSNISVQSIDPITQDFNFRKLSTFAF